MERDQILDPLKIKYQILDPTNIRYMFAKIRYLAKTNPADIRPQKNDRISQGVMERDQILDPLKNQISYIRPPKIRYLAKTYQIPDPNKNIYHGVGGGGWNAIR